MEQCCYSATPADVNFDAAASAGLPSIPVANPLKLDLAHRFRALLWGTKNDEGPASVSRRPPGSAGEAVAV